MLQLLSLLLLLLVKLEFGDSAAVKSPVVLVPGDGGSQLWATLHNTHNHWYCEKSTSKPTQIWLDLVDLVYPAVNCLAYNLKLNFDPNTHHTVDNDGVNIQVPGFGNTETVEWLAGIKIPQANYYHTLVKHLVDNFGYKRGVNVHGAPFDFRKAPNELTDYYEKLTALIESTYSHNDNTPAVLVGHSLGCKVLLHFLHIKSAEWKRKYVKVFIAAAGPFGGASSGLLSVMSGYNLNLPFIKPMWFREAQRSWPSSYYLFPSGLAFNESFPIVTTKQRHYTLSQEDLRQLFQDMKFPEGYLRYKLLGNVTIQTTPPLVPTVCVYGYGLDTTQQLRWTGDKEFPDHQPDVVKGDGDGTVNIASLDVCRGWAKRQPQAVNSVPISGAEHLALLSKRQFLDSVVAAATVV